MEVAPQITRIGTEKGLDVAQVSGLPGWIAEEATPNRYFSHRLNHKGTKDA